MPNEFINIKCNKCGQPLQVKNPGKPGTFQIICSHCQLPVHFQLQPKPLRMESGGQAPAQAVSHNKVRVPLLTNIVPAKNGKGYAVKPMVKVGQPYGFRCPTCGKPVLFKLPQPGIQGIKCRQCSTQFYAKAAVEQPAPEKKPVAQKKKKDAPAENVTTQPLRRGNKYPGMLSWGNIFSRKKFVLHEGTYILGRKSEGSHSDIEFNDVEMSRRSVSIEVQHKETGYFFKLTVLKATNSVLLNNKPMAETESVYLKYGDTIQMGHTVISFKQQQLNK